MAETLPLTRRERQIMDVIFQKGKASVADVMDALPDPPSYSAVRALLRLMEEKGYLCHRQDGPRYVYHPASPPDQARQSACKRLVYTFFSGSVERTVAALLNLAPDDLSEQELDRLAQLIENHRTNGDPDHA